MTHLPSQPPTEHTRPSGLMAIDAFPGCLVLYFLKRSSASLCTSCKVASSSTGKTSAHKEIVTGYDVVGRCCQSKGEVRRYRHRHYYEANTPSAYGVTITFHHAPDSTCNLTFHKASQPRPSIVFSVADTIRLRRQTSPLSYAVKR